MILLLVFGALVLLSIPSIQSSLAQSLTEKINKDFGVNLKIERLGINWKGVIDLREVLILDHHQDTLIQASKISTNILSLTDLEASRWAFGRLSLDEALLRIITYEDEPKHSLDHFLAQFPPSQEEDLDQEAFMLLIGRLALQDTRIEIKDYNPEFQSDLAFNHVFLSARDFRISGPDLGAKINSMGFESNFGLYVSKLSGDYYYDSASMGIANMNLITPQLSDLRGDLSLSYPQGMNDFSDKVYLELDLEEGSVIAKDGDSFAKTVTDPSQAVKYSAPSTEPGFFDTTAGKVTSFVGRNVGGALLQGATAQYIQGDPQQQGSMAGAAYEGLVKVNDHWVLFPKIWKA